MFASNNGGIGAVADGEPRAMLRGSDALTIVAADPDLLAAAGLTRELIPVRDRRRVPYDPTWENSAGRT